MAASADALSIWSDGSSVHIKQSPIEPDSGDDDSSILSTRSLRESLLDHISENGRTYNRFGDYLLPCDQPEIERLNLQYVVMQQLFGNKVHFAPIKRPRRVLDIGTGTGIWCVEMAKKYPDTTIVGMDTAVISAPTQLPNIRWEVQDANDANWGRSFDFIHTRMMLGAFNDFRTIINRAFDNLEPGGWMESQELWPRAMCDDETLDPNTHRFSEFIQYQDQAMMRLGLPLRIANKLKRWYIEAGFVDVREEIVRIPINGWPKDPRYKMLGKWWGRSLIDGLQGFAMACFTRAFNWTAEEVEVYLVDVRRSIADRSVHAYHSIYTVYGRKPTPQEQEERQQRQRQAAWAASSGTASGEPLSSYANHGSSVTPNGRPNGDPSPSRTNRDPTRPPSGRPNGESSSSRANHGSIAPPSAKGHYYGQDQSRQNPQQTDRTSQNSNRRPKHPFSASPHPNA